MTNCRCCNKPIKQFFSLGNVPLVNSFLSKKQLSSEKKYDLSIGFCSKCYLVQLMKTVSPEDLFRNYIYFSSTSKTILEHNEKTASYLTKKLGLKKASLVLELASNDGALLQFFKKLGIQILGVDPAKNIVKIANKKGIRTIAEFFNFSFAKKLKKDGIEADLVYGANVLAHVPKIVDFVKGVKTILKPKGTAVFEFPYLKGLLENKFDIIYQEHVFYYGILALVNLFNRANLEIYDVKIIPMQGGSLRIFASHPKSFAKTKNLKSLIKLEKKEGFDKLSTYKKMNANVTKLKKDLISLLKKLKSKGKEIVAYSAPAKGVVLLNYFEIGSNYLDFIVDKAKEKQGLYVPGVHIKVEPPEKIMKEMPDYVLILCWNIAKEVMTQLNDYKKAKGHFIIPVPHLKII